MLQLGEEPLDQIALAIEALAEAVFPASVALRRDIGRSALFLDQRADAISVIGFVGQKDRVWAEMVEQRVSDLPVMRLSSSKA